MKKVIFLAVCCILFITGCGQEKYQITDLTLEYDGYNAVYIKGKVKNNSGKKCGLLSVNYEYGSGSLMEDGSFLLEDLNDGEIRNLYEFTSIDENENIDTYVVKVKKVNCLDAN